MSTDHARASSRRGDSGIGEVLDGSPGRWSGWYRKVEQHWTRRAVTEVDDPIADIRL